MPALGSGKVEVAGETAQHKLGDHSQLELLASSPEHPPGMVVPRGTWAVGRKRKARVEPLKDGYGLEFGTAVGSTRTSNLKVTRHSFAAIHSRLCMDHTGITPKRVCVLPADYGYRLYIHLMNARDP